MNDQDTSLLKINPDPIRDNIQDDEEILWQGKPQKFAFVMEKIFQMLPVALLFGAFDGFMLSGIIIGYEKSGKEIPIFLVIFLVVFFSFHLLPLWIWLSRVITAGKKYKNSEYCITDRKVIIQFGLMKKEIKIIQFENITTIYSKINLFEKLLGIGDLYLYVAKDSYAYSLNDIAQPREIEAKLKQILSAYNKETEKSLNDGQDYDKYDYQEENLSNSDSDSENYTNTEENTSNLNF
ncbi:MAG: PH domain-containing protein [Clostridia bacterium]|nr:PH domain-containing protein [Clostridia bacterium]